jgi:uncharacterized membrane protein required for colicin V production
VDLAGFIGSLTLADGVLVALFAVAFFLGYTQGVLRQLLGIGVFLVAFIVGAYLRAPVGSWLASNWTWLPVEFSAMVAFVASFLVLLGVMTLGVQVYYQRVVLAARYAVLDEIAGGVLAVLIALLVISVLILAGDSYYHGVGIHPPPGDVGWMRSLFDAFDGSLLVRAMRDGLIPGLLALLGPLLPEAVRSMPA